MRQAPAAHEQMCPCPAQNWRARCTQQLHREAAGRRQAGAPACKHGLLASWIACRDAPLRETVTLSRLAPDTAPLPPRRLELYINALSSEGGPDGAFYTSELCRQVQPRGAASAVCVPLQLAGGGLRHCSHLH